MPKKTLSDLKNANQEDNITVAGEVGAIDIPEMPPVPEVEQAVEEEKAEAPVRRQVQRKGTRKATNESIQEELTQSTTQQPQQPANNNIISTGQYDGKGNAVSMDLSGFGDSVRRRVEEAARRLNQQVEERELQEVDDDNADAEANEVLAQAAKLQQNIDLDDKQRSTDDEDDDPMLEDTIGQLIDGADAYDAEKQLSEEELDALIREEEKDFQRRLDEKFGVKTSKSVSELPILTNRKSNLIKFVQHRRENNIQTRAWALNESGKVVIFRAIDGVEVEWISSIFNERANQKEHMNMLKAIYAAIVNDQKPDFLTWARTTPATDIYNILDGIFYASFDGANYLRYDCDNEHNIEGKPCKYIGLTDSWDILAAKNYETEADPDKRKATEARFNQVSREQDTDLNTSNMFEVVPLSDKIAANISIPSLYSVYIESRLYGNSLEEKYGEYIPMIQQIDMFYEITPEGLIPVDWKRDDNVSRDFRNKVVEYYKILSRLTVEEYNTLTINIKRLVNSKYSYASFKTPDAICEKCGHTVKGSNLLGGILLLQRARLRQPRA